MVRKKKTDVRANGAPFIDIGIPDKDREKLHWDCRGCSPIPTACI